MRLIRGVSVPFVAIPACVTFASHMFRLNVARARFCFNFWPAGEISVRAATMARARLACVMSRAGGTGAGSGRSDFHLIA